MGNRAVIALGTQAEAKIGFYLHWNGSPEQVEMFLQDAREKMKGREGDEQYSAARLAQVIGDAIDGNLSFGLDTLDRLDTDNGDNGTYYVDLKTLRVVERVK